MKVRVLGCHGSDQLVATAERTSLQCGTCGILFNDSVLIDAGTVGSRLHLDEQKRIRVVLLTHLHFDHIRSLPTLADNLVGEIDEPVVIASIPEVLKGLEAHIFNGEVYPDFFRLPDAKRPVFVAQPLEIGRERELFGMHVTPIAVNHVVPTVGYILRDDRSAVLHSGDTYQTDELWRVGRRLPSLKAAFVETSFPDDMQDLAKVSKHLTPSLMAQEVWKLKRPDVQVFAYHMKPRFRDRIIRELQQASVPRLTALEEGQEFVL